jgi:hypothetical protein
MVKPELNAAIKKVINDAMNRGFVRPDFDYLIYDDDRLD